MSWLSTSLARPLNQTSSSYRFAALLWKTRAIERAILSLNYAKLRQNGRGAGYGDKILAMSAHEKLFTLSMSKSFSSAFL